MDARLWSRGADRHRVDIVNGLTIAAAAALAFWLARQWRAKPDMRHFTASEFGPYWPLMSPRLLTLLDEFRDRLGYPVLISPAPGGIGRPVIGSDGSFNEEEAESGTQHNWVKYGEIRAIDVFPQPPGGATPEERRRWLKVAQEIGFTGIGIYPDWKPGPGMHLDVREDRQPGRPALWAGLRGPDGRQTYTEIARAFV